MSPKTSESSAPFSALIALMAAEIERRDEALLEKIGELLDERRESVPALLDRSEMATKLGVCVDTLDKLRRKPGFPELRILDSPRFELEAVLGWLRKQSKEGAE